MSTWDRFVETFFNAKVMAKYLPDILSGMVVTIELAVLIVISGLFAGLVLALLRALAIRPLNWLIIFVVDLYNEGVDIPNVDTVLFLRPTESLTVFLQQLGRGLRLADNKDCLTVLDFVGQSHQRYRFDIRLGSLLSKRSYRVAD